MTKNLCNQIPRNHNKQYNDDHDYGWIKAKEILKEIVTKSS